ncbi:hypothetical protein SteCoe_25759 [Stentor coeruleus]|uniref:Uncharacterized protein n=1 Tax=Stentor coeruleus TaxID=5963 RepID=A0A1R2BET9_9CILI|nr:hypothetical protein SteCoe_25759 [Stentor coeruleus]
MAEFNSNQDLDNPLLCQNDDDIDSCPICSCAALINRMVYEYNKPHNRIENIILAGFPGKCIYNYSGFLIALLAILCFVPFIGIISIILLSLLLLDLKKKYLENRKIVKKPWKNMLVIDNRPMTFFFATFTTRNLNQLYDKIPYGIPESKVDELREKIEKVLLERPIITVCSSTAKAAYKNFNSPCGAITFLTIISFITTGIAITIIYFTTKTRF